MTPDPDGEPPKKRRKNQIPAAVEQEIKKDLAAMPKGKYKGLQAIADKWGVTKKRCHDLMDSQKMEIMALREQLAQHGFMLAARIGDRLVEKLEDQEQMDKTPFHHMAASLEKVIDSSVTAMDGHQAVYAPVNFQFLRETARDVDRFDEIMRAKRAKARVVEPKGLPME